MADVFTKRRRSWIMSRIKGRKTGPEILLIRILRGHGHRVRANERSLPGSPDAVLPKRRIAVFVHGCFWHGHPGCRRAKPPTSNRGFWRRKIRGNRRRDARQARRLRKAGWSVAVFWTCRPISPERVESRIRRIAARRRSLSRVGALER
jgi:DNA mismatch endonuclease (patch repair protein)